MHFRHLCFLACALPGIAQAAAHFEGDVSLAYGVAAVSPDGYEDVAAWISIDRIRGDSRGPLRPPPLALEVRLNQSPNPNASGFDVAYTPIGYLEYEEELEYFNAELSALDIPAGEYWLHLLLTDDDSGAVLDSRTLSPPLLWRGGIDAVGPLELAISWGYRVDIRIPEIVNRRLYDHSDELELTLYATHDGPAGAADPLCQFSLPGLALGAGWYEVELSCELPHLIDERDRLHLEVREIGQPHSDVISEAVKTVSCCTDPYDEQHLDIYAAGGLGHLVLLPLLLLGLRRWPATAAHCANPRVSRLLRCAA